MTPTKTETPGLLHASQGSKRATKKLTKVTTTVRFDPELKRQAELFAREHHMDFTTFLQFSVKTVMKHGATIEPVWHVSPEYTKRLEEIDKDIEAYDQGELEGVAGPFSGDEAVAYLKSLY